MVDAGAILAGCAGGVIPPGRPASDYQIPSTPFRDRRPADFHPPAGRGRAYFGCAAVFPAWAGATEGPALGR